jgi:hypothetical protein
MDNITRLFFPKGTQTMKIEKVPFAGWKNCIRIDNSQIEVIATTDVGPRIISCGFKGKENLFYNNPEEVGTTGGKEYVGYGGHRLWAAPELAKRTYYSDNFPVEVKTLVDGVLLTSAVETTTGIQKSMEIHMDEKEPKVLVRNSIKNCGLWPIPLAPWALTVMAAKGIAILPVKPRDFTPGLLLPSHAVSIWPYTRMTDPRFTWGDDYILLRQDVKAERPTKVAVITESGWAAYVLNNTAFIKSFMYVSGADYVDFGSNLQSWTNKDCLELESLGPIKTLDREETVTYDETWFLAENVPSPANDADVNKSILPIVKKVLKK